MIHTLNRRHSAFTLIELLVVLVIILILAGSLMAVSSVVMKKMKESKAKGQIEALSMAFESYSSDWGFYPQWDPADVITEDFMDSISRSDNGRPFIDVGEMGLSYNSSNELVDPWGNPYWYQSPGTMNSQRFDLWSLGADGMQGDSDDADDPGFAQTTDALSSDDIANWKRMD